MVPNMIRCSSAPAKDPMDSPVDKVKASLLAEYERVGRVDIAAWVGRYPEYRDEIIDFWMWAKGTPREADMKVGPFPALDTDVTESTFRDACLAVNLGRQWLEAPHDPGAAAVRAIFDELSKDYPKSDDEMISWYRDTGVRLVEYARKTGIFDVPADYKLEVVQTPIG